MFWTTDYFFIFLYFSTHAAKDLKKLLLPPLSRRLWILPITLNFIQHHIKYTRILSNVNFFVSIFFFCLQWFYRIMAQFEYFIRPSVVAGAKSDMIWNLRFTIYGLHGLHSFTNSSPSSALTRLKKEQSWQSLNIFANEPVIFPLHFEPAMHQHILPELIP